VFNRTDNQADASSSYIGRFAPSPTGPLHFGSLLAALASYFDAKKHHGQWLIRIEDLDPPREMPGAVDLILKALEAHQLFSDQDIIYQSQRHEAYQQALQRLIDGNHAFPCQCSRKQLSETQGIHLGRCLCDESQPHAWRYVIKANQTLDFLDQLQGLYQQASNEIGDFVIRRKDQLWAYQLALVVDDEFQNISHVVRGIDLIDSTLRQNQLQQALGYSIPGYAHIPVACADNGQKLSKQNHAPPLDNSSPAENIWQSLSWLRQKPPENLQKASVKELLAWGCEHWDIQALTGIEAQDANLL